MLAMGETGGLERKKNMKNDLNETMQTAEGRKKQNTYFIIGGICIVLVILNHQFGILSIVLPSPMDHFAAGLLTGLGLLLEFSGFYASKHGASLKQWKRDACNRNKKD